MAPKTERFELRLDEDLLASVDAWRTRQQELPSRAEAIRQLLQDALSRDSGGVSFSTGEKLSVLLLAEIHEHLGIKSRAPMISSAIYNGHYWALEWEMAGLFSKPDKREWSKEVVDTLDMWEFIEEAAADLSDADREKVAAAHYMGKHLKFWGWDGNHEYEHLGLARFMIDTLGRFSQFKGREMNSHRENLTRYRRMVALFDEKIRPLLVGRRMTADEIIAVLNAGTPNPN